MSKVHDEISAEGQLVTEFKDKLTTWVDELGILADFAANAERTGVAPDTRTTGRAKSLVDELDAWSGRTAPPATGNPNTSEQRRIAAVLIAALSAEAKEVARKLRVDV